MKSIFNQKIILITILLLSVCFIYPVLKYSGEPKSFQLTANQLLKKEGKWYYFKKGAKITINELIEKNYEFFNLPQGVSSNIEKEDVDEFGMKHYLLKLEIYGIPIEDAFYTAHYSKDGELLHVVGDYDKNVIPKEKTIPKITIQEAFELAKNEFLSSEKNHFSRPDKNY